MTNRCPQERGSKAQRPPPPLTSKSLDIKNHECENFPKRYFESVPRKLVNEMEASARLAAACFAAAASTTTDSPPARQIQVPRAAFACRAGLTLTDGMGPFAFGPSSVNNDVPSSSKSADEVVNCVELKTTPIFLREKEEKCEESSATKNANIFV